MGLAAVLGSMRKPERCKHTGLAIPECSCRACCEALLSNLLPPRSAGPLPSSPTPILKLTRPIVMSIAFTIAITIGGCGAGVLSTGAESLRLTSASQAEIDYVVDGDTLSVRQASGSLAYVRLVGIDTPEEVRPDYPTECGAEEAARSMRRLAPEGAVALLRRDSVADATDSYGRMLAHAVVNGRQLEIAQLRRGWAYVYRYDDQHFDGLDRFERAERHAREARLGVWGRCNGDFHSAEPGLQP